MGRGLKLTSNDFPGGGDGGGGGGAISFFLACRVFKWWVKTDIALTLGPKSCNKSIFCALERMTRTVYTGHKFKY